MLFTFRMETLKKTDDIDKKGTLGKLLWHFTKGTLTISGKGEMLCAGQIKNPWHDLCYLVSKVEIGDEVVNICDKAFYGFKELKNIVIGKSVQTIGNYAFSYCSKLSSISIPNTTTEIGNFAFSACIELKTIDFSNSLTRIGISAFNSCYKLASIEIPRSVTTICSYAFFACSALKTIAISASVVELENESFLNCSSLTAINVEKNNIKYSSINGVLFNKDKTLLICCPSGKKGIYKIPATVTTISENAFYKCSWLTKIINYAELPQTIGANTFSQVNKQACILQIPEISEGIYRYTDGWKEFKNIDKVGIQITFL